ncbi:MAG: hypothetical protein WA921_10710 [Ahrensia sp.]
MRSQIVLATAAALSVAACTQPAPSTQLPTPAASPAPAVVQPSPGRTCDVSLIDSIGQPISSVRVPDNGNYRIIRPNDFATADASETRTNIDLNADDTIAAVYCG